MPKLCIYATDLHGKVAAYRQLFRLAHAFGVKGIVLGGDLTPKRTVIKTRDGYHIPTNLPDSEHLQLANQLRQSAIQGRAGRIKYVEQDGQPARKTELSLEELCRQQELFAKLRILAANTHAEIFLSGEIDEAEKLLLPAIRAFENLPGFRDRFRSRIAQVLGPYSGNPDDWFLSNVLRLALASPFKAGLNSEAAARILTAKTILGEYPGLFYGIAEHLEYQRLSSGADAGRKDQRDFLEDYLLPEIREYRVNHPAARTFAQFGNDDIIENTDLFEDADRDGILYYIHNRVRPFIGGLHIAGSSFVTHVPAQYKAWELDERGFLERLNALAKCSDPAKTVYVLHMPPINTNLDRTQEGPIGSVAVHDFLLMHKPHLLLTGHVHEAPYVSGTFCDDLGTYDSMADRAATIGLNPGGWHDAGKVDALIFDPQDPVGSHTWVASSALFRSLNPAQHPLQTDDVVLGGLALRILLNAENLNGDHNLSLRGRKTRDVDVYVRELPEGRARLFRDQRIDVFSAAYPSKLHPEESDVIEAKVGKKTYRVITPEFFAVAGLNMNPGIWEITAESIIALNLKFKLNKKYIAALLRRAKMERFVKADEIIGITDTTKAAQFRKKVLRRLAAAYPAGRIPSTVVRSFMAEICQDLPLPLTHGGKLEFKARVLTTLEEERLQDRNDLLTLLLTQLPDEMFADENAVLETEITGWLNGDGGASVVPSFLALSELIKPLREFFEWTERILGRPKLGDHLVFMDYTAFREFAFACVINSFHPISDASQRGRKIRADLEEIKSQTPATYVRLNALIAQAASVEGHVCRSIRFFREHLPR